MKTVRVRNIVIGEGLPKICVPIVASTKEEALEQALHIAGLPADIVELRADWLGSAAGITEPRAARPDSPAGITESRANWLDFDRIEEVLAGLRPVLSDMPLLFTLRTSEEGGAAGVDNDAYVDFNTRAVRSGLIDMVDVEFFKGSDVCEKIISEARMAGVKVIISNHDFRQTPEKEDLVDRYRSMQETGADILKIAVMPESFGDVLTLLEAAAETADKYAECPIVAISMSETGAVSRIAGGLFGSAITFGSASRASAPGQIGAADLQQALRLFQKRESDRDE